MVLLLRLLLALGPCDVTYLKAFLLLLLLLLDIPSSLLLLLLVLRLLLVLHAAPTSAAESFDSTTEDVRHRGDSRIPSPILLLLLPLLLETSCRNRTLAQEQRLLTPSRRDCCDCPKACAASVGAPELPAIATQSGAGAGVIADAAVSSTVLQPAGRSLLH